MSMPDHGEYDSVAQKRHSGVKRSLAQLRRKLAAARTSKTYKQEEALFQRTYARNGESMRQAVKRLTTGTEGASTGGYLVFGRMSKVLERFFNNQRRDQMSTRAQIGIYEDTDLKAKPVSIIYRHSDGYPTGNGAVLPDLVQFVSEIMEKRGHYDAEYLGAQLLYRFIENHDCGVSGTGYGVSNALHGDIRFYYAVTPEGVHVFDARDLTSLSKLPKEMFFTAWVEPERVRAVEKELSELAAKVAAKQLELRGLKQKQYSGK